LSGNDFFKKSLDSLNGNDFFKKSLDSLNGNDFFKKSLDSLSGNDFFKRNTKAREHAIEELLRHSHYPHMLHEYLRARLHNHEDKDK